MSIRPDLIERWESRLDENRESCSGGSMRFRWLREMYIRLYSFLTSSYRRGGWGTPITNVDCSPHMCEETSSATHLDHTHGFEGKPAKSAGEIRGILKSIYAANDRDDDPGPLANGMKSYDWIAVTSLRSKVSPDRCKELLRQNGIVVRTVSCGDDVIVEAQMAQRDEALKLIDEQRHRLRIREVGEGVHPHWNWLVLICVHLGLNLMVLMQLTILMFSAGNFSVLRFTGLVLLAISIHICLVWGASKGKVRF